MAKEQDRTTRKQSSHPRGGKTKKVNSRGRETVKFWSETVKDALTIVTGLLALMGMAGVTTVQAVSPDHPTQSQQQQQRSTPPERQRDIFAPRGVFALLPPEIKKIIAELGEQLRSGSDPEEVRSKALRALAALEGTVLATQKDIKAARQLVNTMVNLYVNAGKKNPPYMV